MTECASLQLLPQPKTLTLTHGIYRIPVNGKIVIAGTGETEILPAVRRLQQTASQVLHVNLSLSVGTRAIVKPAFTFILNSVLALQAYGIDVEENGITVTYSSPQGAYYAVATLKQILAQTGGKVPCLTLRDQPDFGARGLMIDISRNKIPTQETLYKIVDLMADLKLNELQLYIEGTPFAYETFPQVWALETPVSGEEILLLDAYCKERYIELVPNQNSFGHMEGWLTRPEFNHLAEVPEGFMLPEEMYYTEFYPNGLFMHPGTFNTEDPEVLELLENMYDDLLPYFSSSKFNVGCDETYELGLGKSKDLADREGKGALYLSFLQKIHKLVQARGKTMQFWGDIIIQHPELIPQLPKDIIAMEWGYSAEHPFEADTLKFREAGIPFYVCPGTSAWNSLTGRTDNMTANLRSAAVHGKANGAIGYLITDWGDHGHWQQLPVSYPGFIYGAALAWGVDQNEHADVAGYLNRFVFADRSGQIGQLLLDLGNSYTLEATYHGNDSELSMLLRSELDNLRILGALKLEHFDQLETHAAELEARTADLALECEDRELVLRELHSGLHFVKHAAQLGRLKLQLAAGREHVDRGLLAAQIQDLDLLLHEYRLLWTQRNRPGGLARSTARLERLRGQYAELAAALGTPALA